MSQPNDTFGLDILVELIAAEQGQAIEATPVSRIEARLTASIALAREANLAPQMLFLARQDFAWLCNARGIDRLSSAASVLKIASLPVRRAQPGLDSHIVGVFADGRDETAHPFPVIGDPSLIPDFVRRIPSEAEKADMLERFNAAGRQKVLETMPPGSTRH